MHLCYTFTVSLPLKYAHANTSHVEITVALTHLYCYGQETKTAEMCVC